MSKWLDLSLESLAPIHLTTVTHFLFISGHAWLVLLGKGHMLLRMQTQEPLSQGRREPTASQVRVLDASQDN